MTTALATPVSSPDSAMSPKSRWRRPIGVLLILVGIVAPALSQWSISSLADEIALEVPIPASLTVVEHQTANSPVGRGPLAVLRLRDVQGEPVPKVRTLLRAEGFSVMTAEPESWARSRDDGYDATVWTLAPSNGDEITIEVRTFDSDPRVLFGVIAVVSLAFLVGGALLAASTSFRRRQIGLGALGALLGVSGTTIVVRALHQTKVLIDAHVATHGPLPSDAFELYGFSAGTAAEQLLATELCVAGGLYPFGAFSVVAPITVGAVALMQLVRSRLSRSVVSAIALALCVAMIVVYAGPAGALVDILE